MPLGDLPQRDLSPILTRNPGFRSTSGVLPVVNKKLTLIFRYTKGAESQVMCFEYESGTEDRGYSNPSESGNIQRRPRVCSHDETKNDDNNCICYIIQAAGQSGPKQTPDGAGFRPEIDYLEVCVKKYFVVRSRRTVQFEDRSLSLPNTVYFDKALDSPNWTGPIFWSGLVQGALIRVVITDSI